MSPPPNSTPRNGRVCVALPWGRPALRGRGRTLALFSMPTVGSEVSPSASIRMESEHLAASTLLILPLNLGAACPMSDAW